ncbi:MAG: dihydrolipoyl dehydrogenase [Myxococcota bacterium]|nr:dihydrolipoyl dehydrogenase [Myxococcota bacterium]
MPGDAFDVAIVGAGPGGYVAAIRAGRLGLRAAVIDRGQWGGACLHWGCIPSKALIRAARLAGEIRRAGRFGIRSGAVEVDVPAMMAWKDGVVRRLSAGVRGLLRSAGAEAIAGEATIEAPGRVRVRVAGDGGERVLEVRAVVAATGARPIGLPGLPFDGARVVSAKEALSLRAVPDRLLVIGGGAIGIELGTAWALLGSKVAVVEMMPQILPGFDPDAAAVVEKRLRRGGVEVMTGAKVEGAAEADGALRVDVRLADGSVRPIDADVALVAVGMRPDPSDAGLERLGPARDGAGFVRVDERLRTSIAGLYAIGDLTGPPLLAHRASRQGEIAAEAIAGRASEYRPAAVPAAVCCEPEVAAVGITEAEAARMGRPVRVGRFPFAASGRAAAGGDTDGFVKVVACADDGRVLGVQIVGPEASELIGEATLAVECGLTARRIGEAIHAHPTLAEALMEAARAVAGEATHVIVGTRREPG